MKNNINNISFNQFCHEYCDGLYNPKLPYDNQSTGYKELRKMVIENITPATISEIERWETSPTIIELTSIPETKYLRFLHPILRPYIIDNWDRIKNMNID